ncbi:MAG: slipin family protein [Desulfobacterales bacterium]|nr:slipin family protein [Desulfobacterales bacterium]
MNYLIYYILLVVLGIVIFKYYIKQIIVFEYEKGLKYVKGKFKGILEPGQYWYFNFMTSIIKVDIRPSYVSICGQEVLSLDGVTLKVTLVIQYQVVEPDIAINKIQKYQDAVYTELQLALREIIGNTLVDDLLEKRNEISKKLMEMREEKILSFGIKLLSVNVKDIMFPGSLKDIFAQVVKAKKEGLAALEKARGETAALRNLANAAKMIESNPNLINLRLIQSLGTSGNTLVLGMPSQPIEFPIKIKDKKLDEITETNLE